MFFPASRYMCRIHVIIISVLFITAGIAGQVYVDQSAPGTGDGSSWENAFTDLGYAVSDSTTAAEIWIAAGIYNENLVLKTEQKLYGGFSGSEESKEERDFENNITVIDGGGQGRVITAGRGNILDHLTITNGQKNTEHAGAGIYSLYGIRIENCVIDNNHGGQWGGAVFIKTDETYAVKNNVFMRNSCTFWGASLLIYQASNGNIVGNVFTDNSSSCDGNLFLYASNPYIGRNIFCGNRNFILAAGIKYFGSHSKVVNNLFVGNKASKGVAVYHYGYVYGEMKNNTIAFNESGPGNAAIDLRGRETFDYQNNILAFNTGYGMKEIPGKFDTIPQGRLTNNLFYQNSLGCYYDYDSETVIDTEDDLNSLDPPGDNTGNIIANPGFMPMEEGTWTKEPVFHDIERKTVLFNSNANWVNGELCGKFLNPDLTENLQFYIIDNTETSITVWGNLTSLCSAGSNFRIHDYHLVNGSPAINSADNSVAPEIDFDGDLRPGADGESDIGFDEAPDEYAPSSPPYCEVSTPQGEQEGVVSIQYRIFDHESNLTDIYAEYSLDGGETFSEAINGSGGDGVFDLESSPSGTSHVFAWNTFAQGISGREEHVRIRITPVDFETGTPGESWDFTVYNPPPESIKNYDFTIDEEGWTSFSLPGIFTSPGFDCSSGHISITTYDHNNSFGFWQSPLTSIPVEDTYIYRAKFSVSSNVADPERVPLIRFRASPDHSRRVDMIQASSRMEGEYSPGSSPRDYSLYFVPCTTSDSGARLLQEQNTFFCFDVVNFDNTDVSEAVIQLNDVEITRMKEETLGIKTTAASWDFEDNAGEGWHKVTIPSEYTPPEMNTQNGALELTGVDDETFGFWCTDFGQLEVQNNCLYKATFTVGTDVTDCSKTPGFRFRINTETYESALITEVSSFGEGEYSPGPESKTYEAYFYPPQHLEGTELNDLLVSFDMKSFSSEDDIQGTLKLENMKIETFSIPE